MCSFNQSEGVERLLCCSLGACSREWGMVCVGIGWLFDLLNVSCLHTSNLYTLHISTIYMFELFSGFQCFDDYNV